jgi:hypothetical protein
MKSLQAQLNATKASHTEALSEIELLKLKVLSNKKAEWLMEVSKTKGIVDGINLRFGLNARDDKK